MQAKDIAELLNEPACTHNTKSKSGCARPKPGATAGGCSFDGAQIALLPIADVAHIVHGPIACAGSSWDNRGTRSSGPTLYRIGMTTDLTEQDVIMGRGEKRLFHAIKQAVDSYSPKAVFVYNTCVPALIGDDIGAVCKAAAEKCGVPVVPVDCAGFYGTKNLGNRIAGEAMFKYVVGTGEPLPVPAEAQRPGITVHDVNLIGEYNIAGEFWNVLPLFDELGLRILCTLSGDARFHDVQTMHRAEANMVVCAKALLNVARKLQTDYKIPYFEGSFYGVTDTSMAFREFAKLLNDASLNERVEAMIAREEAKINVALEPWREKLRGKRVLLYTGGVKSWSIVSALQDLGHGSGCHRHQQVHRGRQGAHPRDHGRKDQDDHRRQPQGFARCGQGIQGRHPDRGRPQHVHRAEGKNPVSRHQPGTRIRLRRLQRHDRTRAPACADPAKPGMAGGAHACAMGEVFGARCRTGSGGMTWQKS